MGKLLKHIERINEWNKKGSTLPIMINIDLTNRCNNMCPRCIRTSNSGASISLNDAKKIILQLKSAGVKSLGLGGGGDPTCNPDFAKILYFAKQQEIETGVYTNGYMLKDSVIKAIIQCCTYVRISLDADSPESYFKTHGMSEKAYNAVLNNIKRLVQTKNEMQSDITIGIGILIDKKTNINTYAATKMCKELGVDYVRFRPFFNEAITNLNVSDCTNLANEKFTVSFTQDRKKKREYGKCFVTQFTLTISADQKVYPCCHLSNNARYCIGDLKTESFKKIWDKKDKVLNTINLKDCPEICVLDSANKLLWGIKQPLQHENFL